MMNKGTYNDFLSALNSVIVKDSFSLLTLIGGMSLFQRHAESLPISRILLAPDFVRNSYWYASSTCFSTLFRCLHTSFLCDTALRIQCAT